MKSNKGFTLVELIVVIAILAILAGIAIPAYSGYLAKANEAADSTTLSAVKTAAFAATATEGSVSEIEVKATDGVVSEVVVTYGSSNTEINVLAAVDNTDVDDDFKTFYGATTIPNLKSETYQSGATWTATEGAWN